MNLEEFSLTATELESSIVLEMNVNCTEIAGLSGAKEQVEQGIISIAAFTKTITVDNQHGEG